MRAFFVHARGVAGLAVNRDERPQWSTTRTRIGQHDGATRPTSERRARKIDQHTGFSICRGCSGTHRTNLIGSRRYGEISSGPLIREPGTSGGRQREIRSYRSNENIHRASSRAHVHYP